MRIGKVPPATRVRRRTRLLAGAIGAAALFASSTVGAAPGASAASERTLTAAMNASGIDTLNPFLAFFDGALETFGMIYPSLNQLDRSGQAGPYLAESWSTSADKLSWTFKLDGSRKWSDGKPITAEDAAWTFNLIMTNDTAATANGSLVENFESVTAPDATTLVIKTKEAQANLLYVTPPILPKHVWESHVKDLKSFKNDSFPVVGYGPWILTGYTVEQFETFTVNKDFKLGKEGRPKYDKLVLQEFKNGDAAVAALKSNQISYLHNFKNSTAFNALKGDSAINAVQEVGSGWTAVEVNSGAKTRSGKAIGTGNPLLADAQVRSAINMAMDKKKLVSNVIGGLGVAGDRYLPPAFPQWDWKPASGDAVSYDPAKANSILDAAGYAKGSDGVRAKGGKKLSIRLGIHSDSSRDAQTSQFLKGWLKAVGIELKIESLSMTNLNANLAKGDWDMLMDSWGTPADPTYLLSIQTCGTLPKDDGTGGNTDAFYCNPDYDKLFTKQLTTFDPAQRQQVIGQMQEILYKANADIILYYPNLLSAVRKDAVSNVLVGKANSNGLYPVQQSFWSYHDATPPGQDSKKSSSSSALLYGGGALVLVLLVGAVVALRRRSTATERE